MTLVGQCFALSVADQKPLQQALKVAYPPAKQHTVPMKKPLVNHSRSDKLIVEKRVSR